MHFPTDSNAHSGSMNNGESSGLRSQKSDMNGQSSFGGSAATSKVDVRSATNSELKDELARLRSEYDELIHRMLNLEQEFRTVQDQKYQLAMKVEKLTTENNDLRKYSDELLEQRNELLRKMNDEQASKVAEVKGHQSLFHDMEATIRSLTERNAMLTNTLESYQRSVGKDTAHPAARLKVSLSDSPETDRMSPDSKPYGSGKLMELHEWLTQKDILPKQEPVLSSRSTNPSSSTFRLSEFETPSRIGFSETTPARSSASSQNRPTSTSSAQKKTSTTAKKKRAPSSPPTTSALNASNGSIGDRREIGVLRLGSQRDPAGSEKKRSVPLLKIDLASDVPIDSFV